MRFGRPATRLLLVIGLLVVGCSGSGDGRPPGGGSPATGPGASASGATAAAAGEPLFDTLGSYHRAITTRSTLAQSYFDQGLRLVYGFNHDEAERSFREAARLDPQCAMAWWGVALALGPNINLPIDPDRNRAAVEAIGRALALVSKASPVEADFIGALAKRYSSDPGADRARLDRDYAEGMGEVVLHHPEDLDAATLYAESLMDLRPWHLWTLDGKPEEGTEKILSVLESVLARDANHPGANHYYIHAVEASNHPERALASARRLETLVPGAGHLVHMPAHIYMRTGDYAAASKSNATAAAVDEAYIKARDVKGIYPLMYYSHNLHFLAATASMEGRGAAAKEAAARLVESVGPMVKEMPMGEFVMPTPLYVALRFQHWDEILSAPEPDASMTTTRALRHFARGVALAARGDLKGARSEQRLFSETKSRVAADLMFNLNRAQDVLAVADAVLEARLLSASGDRGGSIRAWERAVAAQDRLSYDEPPAWYYPVRESLGAEMLRTGRAREAEAIFKADLERSPGNGRSLFGLWKSLAAQKRVREAEAVRREFDAAWKAADTTLRIEAL